MLGYQPMQMDNTQWSKPSFQHPPVPQQLPTMTATGPPQRKVSMAPLDVAIASPPFEPPQPPNCHMDQNHVQ
ncbi:hypothetical protein ANCCAN_14438 [Ancylostoma caninum]|uniref:Uncharacterized protein n=1 Tax=Ancylostoma caninum TaxID=29170 RepID=A0A368G5C3_ANCCA|nr:hypothetical protein ANCCAN_14438 [Ancylostoma caninum]